MTVNRIPDSAMFFAAGFGRRMAPLTDGLPKPLIKVGGKTLLDHALDQGHDFGLRHAVVNTHYRADQIRAHLHGQEIALSNEQDQILETGGGLRKALPLLGTGPVFTMNTDAVWDGPNCFKTLAQAWDPAKMDGLLLLVPPAQMIGHKLTSGFTQGPDGRLTRGLSLAYTGAQILQTQGLSRITETVFSLNLLWDQMLDSQRLFGVIYPGRWCDVGYPEALPLAEAMLVAKG